MFEKTGKLIWSFGTLAVLGGCATVNPQHDYEQVGQRVIEAIGQQRVYRPGNDEWVDEFV